MAALLENKTIHAFLYVYNFELVYTFPQFCVEAKYIICIINSSINALK